VNTTWDGETTYDKLLELHEFAFVLKYNSTVLSRLTGGLCHLIFGRPFVKWFALCYRTVVLSVCLPVCLSGIRPVKSGGWWRWALLSPDGVVPSQMVGVSASVNLPLHHKFQKFSSGTGSPDGRDCGVEVK